MAGSDYRSCDVCGTKTFYDAKLGYDFDEYPLYGLRLGDWKVICVKCAETHEVKVLPKVAVNQECAHDWVNCFGAPYCKKCDSRSGGKESAK